MEKTTLPTDKEIEEAAQKIYPVNHNLPIIDRIGLNYASHQGLIEGAKWMRKKAEAFTLQFADWLKYESPCFPEHKDKSIEELLEIYKKSI